MEDTLKDELLAWSDRTRRQGKRLKDFADIARLVEAHPRLWETLPEDLQGQIERE